MRDDGEHIAAADADVAPFTAICTAPSAWDAADPFGSVPVGEVAPTWRESARLTGLGKRCSPF